MADNDKENQQQHRQHKSNKSSSHHRRCMSCPPAIRFWCGRRSNAQQRSEDAPNANQEELNLSQLVRQHRWNDARYKLEHFPGSIFDRDRSSPGRPTALEHALHILSSGRRHTSQSDEFSVVQQQLDNNGTATRTSKQDREEARILIRLMLEASHKLGDRQQEPLLLLQDRQGCTPFFSVLVRHFRRGYPPLDAASLKWFFSTLRILSRYTMLVHTNGQTGCNLFHCLATQDPTHCLPFSSFAFLVEQCQPAAVWTGVHPLLAQTALQGNTPLHIACHARLSTRRLRLLVQYGKPALWSVNTSGQTPVDVFLLQGQPRSVHDSNDDDDSSWWSWESAHPVQDLQGWFPLEDLETFFKLVQTSCMLETMEVLVRVHPEFVNQREPQSGLWPFELAATAERSNLDLIFTLLRHTDNFNLVWERGRHREYEIGQRPQVYRLESPHNSAYFA